MNETAPIYFVMPVQQRSSAILLGLFRAQVDFLVIGSMAGVLMGFAGDSGQVDIVPCRTSENVARLHAWLCEHNAQGRVGLPQRGLPTEDALLDNTDILLQTDLGKLSVRRAFWNGGYEGMLIDMVMVDPNSIEDKITNAPTGPAENRTLLPVLLYPFDQLEIGSGSRA